MTRFRYSDYLSQFRHVAGRSSSLCGGGDGGTGDVTSQDVEPLLDPISKGDVSAVVDVSRCCLSRLLTEDKDGWIPLHHAAASGHDQCVRSLLTAHPSSVDKRTLQEQTSLLLAVSCGHLSCVRSLLEAGADPDISDKNRETPLFKACELDRRDLASVLLSFGASVNQRCCGRWTALHEAASRDNTDICALLVGAGAAVNPSNTYSATPLIAAAQRGRMRALTYLTGRGADVNMQTCDGVTALHAAAWHGHTEVVSALLAKNADANRPCGSGLLPLHVAAQSGHHRIVSLLLPVTSRLRLRHSAISPLHLAAQHNRSAAAAVLLRAGVEVNTTLTPGGSDVSANRPATPLGFAAAGGSTETVELLLNAGARLTLDPVSPLLLAVQRGCVATVTLLLDRGADVNARIPCRTTTFPAAVALCRSNLPLLTCLLDAGCDAISCFACTHGAAPHPEPCQGAPGSDDSLLPVTSGDLSDTATQFCEWISAPAMSPWVGPVVDLLLEHVAQVQLCNKLLQLLSSRDDWVHVRRKSSSPRPLLHLCRLRIRSQVGTRRLRRLTCLPLPDSLIRYVGVTDAPTPS